ncbi:FAD-dependent oxidoreductase [Kitasatospora sp. NPDC049285]|uniref:FAD-dependent oxidoreductase n=1 Tax=Kitasatospora sp. NPDC049285 TaxID=3157096 RepID=UPI00342B1277
MKATPQDAELLIVGAGPAGCAAAIMAASIGMTSVLIDAEPRPGGKLWQIGHLENLPGGWTDGPSYARSLIGDLARLGDACRFQEAEVIAVNASEDQVAVTLADGGVLTGRHLIVATGVRAAKASDVAWISAETELSALWSAPVPAPGQHMVVVGADRPLGTWLRTHPDFGQKLTVLHPAADDYKAHEVRDDPRVELVRVAHVAVRGAGPFEIEFRPAGTAGQKAIGVDSVFANLGSVPASLPGLVSTADGYCPPADQHPRITIAGDLCAKQNQRVLIAGGGGGTAALFHYYREERAGSAGPTHQTP